jgi:mannose-6-phosphate isomerase
MTPSLPLDQPLRFQPFFRGTAWGGRAIARFLGKNLPADTLVGESWEISDHPVHPSILATGPLFGATLSQLMARHKGELLGPAAPHHARFPWLVKLLDVHDRLSVQVHPDAVAVRKLLPGEGAKSEAWLVLDAQPGSLIYAGLRPGIDAAGLRAALERGTVVDCLHPFAPRPGDLVYLPAGTVHAVGGGVLMAEIQETSDATFRLYDWDRGRGTGQARPLHIEPALASIDWAQGPIAPTAQVRCPHFAIDRVRHDSAFTLGGAGRLQTLIVAEGQGRFDNGEFVMAGDAWVLPAQMPAIALQVETPLAGLLCSLP